VVVGVARYVSENRRPHRERFRRGDADAWGCAAKPRDFVNPGPGHSNSGFRPLA
jgi:hypothetical protein